MAKILEVVWHMYYGSRVSELAKYKKDIFSQNGQDGVIAEIFRRLKIEKGQFVDVGAWDGQKYSNTFKLLKLGWEGIGIEGDLDKFRQLESLSLMMDNRLVPINAFVAVSGKKSLDNLLSKEGLQEDFDFLNIDIDSFDYWVWKSLENYHPKVVAIEINSGIPPSLPYVQNKDEYLGRSNHKGLAQGASFKSMMELGEKKGYSLVAHVGDLFFVRQNLVNKLNLPMRDLEKPESLFDDEIMLRKFVTPESVWRIGRKKLSEKLRTLTHE